MNLNEERLKSDLHDLGGSGTPMPNIVNNTTIVESEMTLRDRFALAVLQGAAASPDAAGMSWNLIASHAYSAADAMLAERVK